jgi:hypothetical protein
MAGNGSESKSYQTALNAMKNVATANGVAEPDPLRCLSTYVRSVFKDEVPGEDKFAMMLAQWIQNWAVTYAALNSTTHQIISDAMLFKFNEAKSIRILNCTALHLYQGLRILNDDQKEEVRFMKFLRKWKSNEGFVRHTYTFTFPINSAGNALDAKAEKISETCTLSNVSQHAEGQLLRFYENIAKSGDHPVLLFDEQKKRGLSAKNGICKPTDFVLDGSLPLLLQREKDINKATHFETKAMPSCLWDLTFIFSMSREKFQALGPRLDTLGFIDIVDDGSGDLTITASALLCYISFMLRMTTYVGCAMPITEPLLTQDLQGLGTCVYEAPKKDVETMMSRCEEDETDVVSE